MDNRRIHETWPPPRWLSSQGLASPRKFRFRFSLAILMSGITVFCFCCGFFRLVAYEDVATDVSSQEANERFRRAWSFVRVPEAATHVNLYARYQGGGADFDISEKDFKNWCDERGWKVEHRTAPLPFSPIAFIIGPNTTRDGYYFSNSSHRGGWDAMYDVSLQRAWVHYSPR
jgi:hypothetical protein